MPPWEMLLVVGREFGGGIQPRIPAAASQIKQVSLPGLKMSEMVNAVKYGHKWLQQLKANRPYPRNYPHTPTDYRHTDKHLRLVMGVLALCCTRQN